MNLQSVAASTTTISLNGQSKVVSADATLAMLLEGLGLGSRKGIAAAVNDAVVPRGEWTSRRLTGGDRVILIQATQGG